ncbi:MAG: hypothetical protein HRT45_11460 [Bdellovibrionales bacterium]|nr:hypothetical protein [Bdellovibrionales bacterium]
MTGWACQAGIDSSLNIQVWAGQEGRSGSRLLKQKKSDQNSEMEIRRRCNSKGRFRYRIAIAKSVWEAHRGKAIYIYGMKAFRGAPGRNTELPRSGQYTIPRAPSGRAPVSVAPKFQLVKKPKVAPKKPTMSAQDKAALAARQAAARARELAKQRAAARAKALAKQRAAARAKALAKQRAAARARARRRS